MADKTNTQPIRMDDEEKQMLKSIADSKGISMSGAVREMTRKEYLAIVTAPEKGTETVIGVARVTRQDGITTVDDAEGKELIATGRKINHAPAHAPVEAMVPTGRYAEAVALKAHLQDLEDEYEQANMNEASDHVLQCLANEIGAVGKELDALQSVEEKE